MKLILHITIIFLATSNLLLSWFVLFRLHQPTTFFKWLIKVFVCALSPVLFVIGLVTAILGWGLNMTPAIIMGSLSALPYLMYIIKSTLPPDESTDFKTGFGRQWGNQIPLERKNHFLSSRYVLWLPNSPEPILQQDISFHTVEDTHRQLLCDIWQPSKNIPLSGLVFIYLHGSAWTSLDKDFGTRTFFKHLASQGHVIMDVAYRLFPETDMLGMVHDAKHAIAWMKTNATLYGVNPNRIVIGGGSAGAHIALLTAYTVGDTHLTPKDLESADLSVKGVVSLYGQADLVETYYHTCQHLTTHSALAQRKEGRTGGMPSWIQNRIGKNLHRLGFDKNVEPGILAPILGGNPDEKPDNYSLFSPINYVNKDCPPTLLINGKHDILAPIKAIQQLQAHLKESGVPVAMHLIPKTDHAFDLILPKISPSAHNAYYDVERFLAMMINEPT